jgi:hypothetical protein
MNEKRYGTKEFTALEEARTRESIRLGGVISGKTRRQDNCPCGRPRAVVRHGRRWHRLHVCWRCLRRGNAVVSISKNQEMNHV